jgi:hypothetical protein
MLAVGNAPSFGKRTVCAFKGSFRECMVTWPGIKKGRFDGVYEMDIGVKALI